MKKTGKVLTLGLCLLGAGMFAGVGRSTAAVTEDLAMEETAIASLSATSTEAWVADFEGKAGGTDKAVAIAVGDGRSVFVTGQSQGLNTGEFDMVTIKYLQDGPDPLGQPEWTARYDGPKHGADIPVAIAVDGDGNVLVTGSSVGDNGNEDIVTVKYNGSDGLVIWQDRFNGESNGSDRPSGMVLDSVGNVYVTGSVTDGAGTKNIVIIKYDGATGEHNGGIGWVQTYHGSKVSNDFGNCIAVASDGTVYVGGMVLGYMATLKYSSTGSRVWVNRFTGRTHNNNQVNAIGVDADANPIVTGDSDGRFVTIKYLKNGKRAWKKIYKGKNRNPDVAKLLQIDPAGDVFVTGDSQPDIVTIKYDGRRGKVRWTSRFTSADTSTSAGMALDPAGNVYITGSVASSGDVSDIVTLKLNGNNGNVVWNNRFNSEAGSSDTGAGIAVDTGNNTCVTGYSCTATNLCDYTTIKYLP